MNDRKNRNLVQLIKQAAMDAFYASKPCNTYIGKVTKASPLKISIGQKLVLDDDFLDVCERLTEEKTLKKNDRVLLIRQQGGQKYAVIDRIEKGES